MNRTIKLKSLLARIKISKVIYFALILFLFPHLFSAQSRPVLLQNNFENQFQSAIYNRDNRFHTSVRPYLTFEVNKVVNSDSIIRHTPFFCEKKVTFDTVKNTVLSKAQFFVLPLATAGYTISDSSNFISETGIGGGLNIDFTKQLFLGANYFITNATYPDYFNPYFTRSHIFPGEGKLFESNNRYVYQKFTGVVSYSPSAIFNLQVGHGKNFFGDGYRSLLLSDAANNYSYGKITTHIWKVKYVNLFMNLKDFQTFSTSYSKIPSKYAALHYLSIDLAKWINFSLFEGVVWGSKDTLNRRNFDINYLNPIIFYRPVEYAVGSSDNSLIGATIKLSPFKKIHLYGQLILDEFLLDSLKSRNGWWANKYGYQLGGKWVDALSIKNVTLQAEYNTVRPFTYTHQRTMENYGHQNMPLAHPLGANFKEVVAILRYNRNRFYADLKQTYARFGTDTALTNYGSNIFLSYSTHIRESGNYTGQGLLNTLSVTQMKVGYILSQKSTLAIEIGMDYRTLSTIGLNDKMLVFRCGIRSSLSNLYTDFF